MARYGATLTVATGKMPSSQSNFTWLLVTSNFPTAAIDGGSQSILNGGGNLRCYTDNTKTTQLPIESIKFVTGGSPDIEVHGLSGSLDVGDTVYAEADIVAISQPPATDPHGSNHVWLAKAMLHLNDNSYKDSSGNNRDGAANSSPTQTEANHPFGGTWTLFDGSNDYLTLNNSIGVGTGTEEGTISVLHRGITSVNDGGLVCAWTPSSSNGSRMGLRTTTTRLKGTAAGGGFGTSDGISPPADNTTSWLVMTWNATSIKLYKNGVQVGSKALSPSLEIGTVPLTIASYYDFAANWCENAYIGEVLVSDSYTSIDYSQAQYNNQSDPSTFWVTGAWEDQDAGGGIVIPVIMNQLRNQGIS